MVKKRSPRNPISRHPERVAIELARVAGVSLDKIAERYGVGRDSIWRHMEKLPDSYKANLIADIPREELVARAAEETGQLLDHFKLIRNIVEQQLIAAKACNDHFAVSNLTKSAIKANQEVGKLTGEIERLSAPGLTINNTMVTMMESPQFRAFESGLVELARKHPEAKADIIALIRASKDVHPPMPAMIEHAHAAA